MKAILSTILATLVLALAGTANASVPTGVKPADAKPVAEKPAVKRMTIEEFGPILEAMGYKVTAYNDKDGKLAGYSFKLSNVNVSLSLSSNGENIWLNVVYGVFPETPLTEDALLSLISTANDIWPAYINYLPKSKGLRVSMPISNLDVTPVLLREKVDEFNQTLTTVVNAWLKGVEITKAKKAEQEEAKMD